jgi:hypothetical protein
MPPINAWLLRTQGRWADVLPDNLVSAQSENELQRMILRGVAQGARVSDIARSLKLSRAQACQLQKAALLAKAVPVLIYFKACDDKTSTQRALHSHRRLTQLALNTPRTGVNVLQGIGRPDGRDEAEG